MAKIAIPQRGQPIDFSIMYEIINAINDLSTNQRGSTYASLATSISGVSPEDIKVTNTKIVTGYYPFSSQTVSSNATLPFSYDFPGADFRYPPIVTATLNGATSSSPAAKFANIVITNVTSSRVEGQINFGTLQNNQTSFAGGISIIAVGQPM